MTEPQEVSVSTRLFALLRTLQFAIIAMTLFYVGLAEMLRHGREADITRMLPIIAACAAAEALAVLYFKSAKIPQVDELLRGDPESFAGLQAARKWYVVVLAFCAGISLYGFALRVMGSTFWLAAVFYAAGLGLTFYCTPRKP